MEYKKALGKVMATCSRSEQCAFDIRAKLKKWEVSESDTDKIIDALYDDKFLDDERFAEAFVKDKYRFNSWGRIKISYMLKQKGISAKVTESALGIIEEGDYKEKLRSELNKKNKSIKEDDIYKRKAKLMRFMASRGFEQGLVIKAIDDILQE